MKVFYHNDLDGECSAAVVKKAYCESEMDETGEKYISINYNQEFPFKDIVEDELIIIVDFSLQKPGEFEKLYKITKNIIWIDHHQTAIEKHPEMDKKLKGIREVTRAACELTWEYYFKLEKCPQSVRFIGDYDVWKFDFGKKSLYFHYGAMLFDTLPESIIWEKWLKGSSTSYEEIISKGLTIDGYINNSNKKYIKSWGYDVGFEGYNCIVCNKGMPGSHLFDSVSENYDMMIAFVFDGKQYTVSLYSTTVNVANIARKHGGGGHKGAAGFQCIELPFKRSK